MEQSGRGELVFDVRNARLITVPTMYVWSDADTALRDKAAHASGDYVSADYRFEILRGVSHWIPEERSNTLADLLLEWFSRRSGAR